ncbi:MAG: hypothetical protein ACP5D2_01685 [Candidatus Nanoarchaeia archaeon]
MKIRELLQELESKDEYKQFKKQHPASYLATIFYIREGQDEKVNIDFYLPDGRLASFPYPFTQPKIYEDKIDKIEKLDIPAIDIDDLLKVIKQAKDKHNYQEDIGKIIAILKQGIWNITCITPSMSLLRFKINSQTGKCQEAKKEKLSDFIKFK